MQAFRPFRPRPHISEITATLKREIKMKEVQSLLKIMSEGLKTLAHGVESLAEKVDEIAKTQVPIEPKNKKPATTRAKTKVGVKSAKKTFKERETKPTTASDTVLKIVGRSKKGVSTARIMENSGFNQKKVSNIIYRLKKQGKIKNVAKGIYVKS
jgi:hypothetical protein